MSINIEVDTGMKVGDKKKNTKIPDDTRKYQIICILTVKNTWGKHKLGLAKKNQIFIPVDRLIG